MNVVLALLLASGMMASVAAPRFDELGHDFPAFDYADRFGLAVADFDGDGRDDLAFLGSTAAIGTTMTIHVAGSTGNALDVKQSLLLQVDGNMPTRLLAFTAADGAHLLVVGEGGAASEWVGWPLRPLRTFPILVDASSATVGDIDADGNPDLVVRSASTIAAYAMPAATPEWSMPSDGPGEVLLAQLDDDAALEMVLGGVKPARVLDGATRAVDWSYPDRFGTWLASGHFGSATNRGFVGAGDRLTVFSAAPYSPLWDFADELYFNVVALAAVDADGDGVDEIVFSKSAYDVELLDSVTRAVRMHYPALGGAGAIASIATGGPGTPRQLAFAAPTSITIVDAASGNVRWRLESRSAPQVVATIGDVDGDGASELVGSAGFVPWDHSAGLQVRDMRTGATEWLSDSEADPEVYATAPYRLLVVEPVTPSGEKRILVAGTSLYDGRMLLVGGASHDLYLDLGRESGFDSRGIMDAIMLDMDGDGVDDIVAASEPILSWVTGAMLHAYSQAGNPIWQSVGMGPNGDQRINGVFALPPATGAGDEVVAVLPSGLRAFGRLSHVLDWTFEVPNDAAFLVEQGVSGAEIGIEKDGTLSFYQASTRMFLRSFTLAEPIDAVKPLGGRVDRLLVSSGGRLRLIDGTTGTELAQSDFLAAHLAERDQLAVEPRPFDEWRIAAGSDVGMFRYRLALSDRIFASGMETSP
ncbi:hypothetical protein [Dokdonella sp.]|uniref:hypothetical protein n=1 Tax=Dokdonella sp. TaxID=2291710 RepID=UPI002F422C4B